MAATQKVTVTLSVEAVAAIRQLVAEGKADSVSGFVQHAVRTSLEDASGWSAMLTAALEKSGGPMSADERTWADGVLGHTGSSSAA